jgi:hypothetical protein
MKMRLRTCRVARRDRIESPALQASVHAFAGQVNHGALENK